MLAKPACSRRRNLPGLGGTRLLRTGGEWRQLGRAPQRALVASTGGAGRVESRSVRHADDVLGQGANLFSPAGHAEARARLAASRPVSVIRDSSGFVAQRVVAHIVNIGCDIAQQRIAAPADIDAAVRLGLGYPRGALELGDSLGPATILTILRGLQDAYGDPRYRPSPWLVRRAALGVALTTDDT
jgi:hypothetical protein